MPTRNASSSRIWVRSEHARGAYAVRALRQHAREMLVELGQERELSVVVTTDRAIKRLNRAWRRKDRPTDVLSFGQQPGSHLLGDVVISLDTARRQAADDERALKDQLGRLLAHGLLHLLGHDHERPAEARRMAEAEVRLLGAVGLVGAAFGHPARLTFTRAPVSNVHRRLSSGERARRRSRRALEKKS